MDLVRVRLRSSRKVLARYAATGLLAGACAVSIFAGSVAASASDSSAAMPGPSSFGKVKPRPTSTPTSTATVQPTATPTVVLTPSPTAATTATVNPTATASSTPTSSPSACTVFNEQSYCLGTISGINSTIYGVGQHIALRGVTVSAVDSLANTIQVWGFDPCPAGMYCGQGSVTGTIAWNGSALPALDDEIDLYGVTITSSLKADGYVKIG